ncbi:MAG: hypothetical protein QOE77_3986 [Blastocatellia bacterium]|jgi:hypothetical protein|nr:hypothetical protein [Blastocatellia bacterium]
MDVVLYHGHLSEPSERPVADQLRDNPGREKGQPAKLPLIRLPTLGRFLGSQELSAGMASCWPI